MNYFYKEKKKRRIVNWNEKQSGFSYYPVKHIKNQDKRISLQLIVIIILSIALLFFIGVILYFYLFWEKKKRKKKANELKEDEEYDYTIADSIMKISDKKIINDNV